MENPPDWNATWTDDLKALPNNHTSSLADANRAEGLSGGATAGIVVEAVGGLGMCAVAAFLCYSRRKRNKQQTVHWSGHSNTQEKDDVVGEASGTASEAASEAIQEMATTGLKGSGNNLNLPAEMESPEYVEKLEARDVYRRSLVVS
jgi:hypothetical protein